MSLATIRRRGAPIALLSYATLLNNIFAPLVASAAEGERRGNEEAPPSAEMRPREPRPDPIPHPRDPAPSAPAQPPGGEEFHGPPHPVDLPPDHRPKSGSPSDPASPATPVTPQAAPVGGDKTGVSSQAISLPQGAGKIQGMGESFSAQLSTGIATFSVPIQLVPARGAADPALSLAYSSSGGHGLAGVGWEVGWPSISRQTDRGVPSYADQTGFQPNQDRFVFGGGQELVPICIVSGASCSGALAGELMPAWASGWEYFRTRVEGSYERFFWSPDHHTWRVQSKSGVQMELGVPLDGSSRTDALEVDPHNGNHIFKWNVAREYDAYGNTGTSNPVPSNPVVYTYMQNGGNAYLTDIYDTAPSATYSTASVSAYAHHTRLAYATRNDVTSSYKRGWLTTQAERLVSIDVTSKPFSNALAGARELVRRYHLTYDGRYHVSLLTSVQMEGKCTFSVTEDATQSLPSITGCPALPPMTFDYQHVTPYSGTGAPSTADLPGYEGFDDRTISMVNSPDHSVDEDQADLFDINSDGLPDVLVSLPGLYGGKDGVSYNGTAGTPNSFAASTVAVLGVLGATTSDINLANPNVMASDIDGDGTIDLLHQPAIKTYAVYTPTKQSDGSYALVGRAIPQANLQDPHLDLGEDTPDINVMDVNGDGLVDVVRSTGTEMQTFLSLGRYPNGDGNFGSAAWTGPASSQLSLAAVTSCVPWDGLPVQFSDSTIRIADMNGDGLPDIVRVQQGNIHYWPGRGNGVWGTEDPSSCVAGNFSENMYVAMANGPQFSDPNGSGVRLDDVNGDGLDDLVQFNMNQVDIWLNVDGQGFTPNRHIVSGFVPASGPTWLGKNRITDMNGSGTRDLFWGEGGNYRYIDLSGGQRPWVLTHVANGLGKTTDLQYSTSTALMQAAQAAGTPWTSVLPMPVHVVTQMTERDHLDLAGRPAGTYIHQYSYANPVYDGRQREFRGFSQAWQTDIGDANSPTSIAASTFLLGQCVDDESPPAGTTSRCLASTRWSDNPREALKGLPVLTETLDANGTYLTSVHHGYTLRKLYTGLDGREVRVAFESQSDSYSYDTAPFKPGSATANFPDVTIDLQGGASQPGYSAPSTPLTVRGTTEAHLQSSTVVDLFGNTTQKTDLGCLDCAPADSAIVSHSVYSVVLGDSGGWLWRPTETWVDGATGRLHDTLMQYDAWGSPTVTQGVLTGTVALKRFHATGAAIAPRPPYQSADGTFTESTKHYDGFGNLASESAPNNRCRFVLPDGNFGDLTGSELVLAGSTGGTSLDGMPCGATALSTSAQYDRGLQVPTKVFDLHGEMTVASYDGFGRLLSLAKPDPVTIGAPAASPTMTVQYVLPQDPTTQPYSMIVTATQDGPSPASPQMRSTYAFIDGFGRTIVTVDQADPAVGDQAGWIASGLTLYNAKGGKQRAYIPWFWSGNPGQTSLPTTTTSASSEQVSDAFGRTLLTYALDGSEASRVQYHALSVDTWDAADLEAGPHHGTFATAVKDGHGRALSGTERVHVPGSSALELHTTTNSYLPSGEVTGITRTSSSGAAAVTRTVQFDSLGRMVTNTDPNVGTWTYAYNANGEIVGTSDARGCGVNYFYEAAGRVVAEDYSPCLASHQAYSAPDLTSGNGTEVFYRYDTPDTTITSSPALAADAGVPSGEVILNGCVVNPALLVGRVASVSDRGTRVVNGYDGRGRVNCVAKQMALPGAPNSVVASRYAPRWYEQNVTFDAADRPVTTSTGATQVVDATGHSTVTSVYSRRGTVASVSSGYGPLVTGILRSADGPVNVITYGDKAATTTAMTYDARRRLEQVVTSRGAPVSWAPVAVSATPSVFQQTLANTMYTYDSVDNPVQIDDYRNPTEWPAGAQPVTRKIAYDDLNRATNIAYEAAAGADSWVDPYAPEDTGSTTDARLAKPSPHVSFTNRIENQSYRYDWLGNLTNTGDDVGGFYDRSLGAQSNGGVGVGPYQMTAAAGGVAPRDGSLTVAYDAMGNMSGMSAVRNAAAPCLPSGASCSQRYAYDWDELGRLAKARRWDGASLGVATTALPTTTPAVELDYGYDASDNRTLKTAWDSAGNQLQTVYIFGSLELRRTSVSGGDYVATTATEVPYLFAHGVRLGRVHYAPSAGLTSSPTPVHVLLELPDSLGSSSIVLDQGTGELVESTTYQGYGGTESDYRPAAWAGFREDYRFTGKEEDVEVGLQYFGKRYLAPGLGRWISPDPLAVHSPGKADPNLYAYVHGAVLRATDPSGLEEKGGAGVEQPVAAMPGSIGADGHVHPDVSGGTLTFLLESQIHGITASSDKGATKAELCDAGKAGMVNGAIDQLQGLANLALMLNPITASLQKLLGPVTLPHVEVPGATQGGLRGYELNQSYESGHGAMTATTAALSFILPEGLSALGRSGVTGNAAKGLTDTEILSEHLEAAVSRFESSGFTARQARRLATRPSLEPAFRGERIDTFFKEAVSADSRLQHLDVTPRFKFGPDVVDPATNSWWDVTTQAQWGAHVQKYSAQFGSGVPLIYGVF